MWYEIKRTIFGEDKYKIMGMCVGTHFHFALPGSVFDGRSKFLVAAANRLSSQKMVSSYNLLVAADPVLTTLMQSSPYIQGEYLAKDSRMLFYRGGTNLGFDGLYTKFPHHGGLQGYINTIPEIIARIETRYQLWKSALLAHGFDANLVRRYGRKLDYAWNPVKVNKLGTFEQRGMDANLPSYIAGASLLIQKMLLRVYRERLKVVASERGLHEPFTLEKNELHVPPSHVVLRKYQYLSASEGLANDELYAYCKALYNFILPAVPPSEQKFLIRVREMLKTRRTLSDELIADVKKEGLGTRISDAAGAKLALKWSERLGRDLRKVATW